MRENQDHRGGAPRATVARSDLPGRIVHAARLDPALYAEVRKDASAGAQAAAVVLLVALAHGIGGAIRAVLLGWSPVEGVVLGLAGELLFWVAASLAIFLMGRHIFGGAATYAEVARPFGFAAAPGLLILVAASASGSAARPSSCQCSCSGGWPRVSSRCKWPSACARCRPLSSCWLAWSLAVSPSASSSERWYRSLGGREEASQCVGQDRNGTGRTKGMQPSSRFIRWSGIVAMLGGVLWLPYGVLEMLEPWGSATAPYREDVGYEVVTDGARYIAYSLPGSLALLLSALGLLWTRALFGLPTGRLGWVGRILTYLAVVLAVISLGGVTALFDPVFTAGRIFGTLALGGATFLMGLDVWRAGGRSGWAYALVVLGLIGMFLFPLWPLVYAVGWLSEGAGAAIIALFGVGWIAFGWAPVREGGRTSPSSGYVGGGQSN